MAQYASKLLSQQKDRLASDSEPGDEAGNSSVIEDVGEHSERLGSSGDSSPIATPTILPTGNGGEAEGDKTEEGETPAGGGGGGENNNSSETGNSTADERIGKDGQKYTKPPFSYAQLIVQALLASSDRKQTLSNIYQFISDKYPYYRLEDKGWKNSIRHNLSLNQYFMKAPREREGLGFGKGGYWCMHPDYEDKLTSQAYVKRKKKGIPVFPTASLMSR
uniref:Fork-head domain-containing protein n=2 Tax=Amphimedon queenslandica TaxID=400682 RepID=A0A1X7SG41_AMPQE